MNIHRIDPIMFIDIASTLENNLTSEMKKETELFSIVLKSRLN